MMMQLSNVLAVRGICIVIHASKKVLPGLVVLIQVMHKWIQKHIVGNDIEGKLSTLNPALRYRCKHVAYKHIPGIYLNIFPATQSISNSPIHTAMSEASIYKNNSPHFFLLRSPLSQLAMISLLHSPLTTPTSSLFEPPSRNIIPRPPNPIPSTDTLYPHNSLHQKETHHSHGSNPKDISSSQISHHFCIHEIVYIKLCTCFYNIRHCNIQPQNIKDDNRMTPSLRPNSREYYFE
jgi:hypothetical protein